MRVSLGKLGFFWKELQTNSSKSTLELGQRARSLLVNATYLQSAIRAGGDASLGALRQTYIAADKIAGADPNRSLGHRVESSLLYWHQNIVLGQVQVGAVLWNLLGGSDQGKAFSKQWKDSLDAPALITKQPGRPMDLERRMAGISEFALSSCGRWMVTSGGAGPTVWNMQDDAHRPRQIAYISQWFSDLQCTAVGQHIYLAGAYRHEIVLALVDVRTGSVMLTRYKGHSQQINSIALHVSDGKVLVGSGSFDMTIGLLSLNFSDIEDHALAQCKPGANAQTGQLVRYGGHERSVNSITLHVNDGQVLVASVSSDRTLGLLSLSLSDISAQALAQRESGVQAQTAKIARYDWHIYQEPIALHVNDGQVLVASVSSDRTIGLLSLSLSDISTHALAQRESGVQAQTAKIARYSGHCQQINSIALHVSDGKVLIASGSNDMTIGLLSLNFSDIEDHTLAQCKPGANAQSGQLVRYGGHEKYVRSIALHVNDGRVLVASGYDDGMVGILSVGLSEISKMTIYQRNLPEFAMNGFCHALGRIRLACYSGHVNWIKSIALRVNDEQILVTSGCHDGTLGLLNLSYSEIAAQTLNFREPNEQRKQFAHYSGHEKNVSSVKLHCNTGQVWAASGSFDTTIGLLSVSPSEISAHALALGEYGANAQAGQIARYGGHESEVNAIALHVNSGQVLVASGSVDTTIGLLSLSQSEIVKDAHIQHDLDSGVVKPFRRGKHDRAGNATGGKLARYCGHTQYIGSIALHVSPEQVVVASGSGDKTIGLLSLSLRDIANDALAQREADLNADQIARYSGHDQPIQSIALHVKDGQVLVASGSFDATVGLLSLGLPEIERDRIAQRRRIDVETGQFSSYGNNDHSLQTAVRYSNAKAGQLARHSWHTPYIDSIALHVNNDHALVVSRYGYAKIGQLGMRLSDIRIKPGEKVEFDARPTSNRLVLANSKMDSIVQCGTSSTVLTERANWVEWLALTDEAALLFRSVVPSAHSVSVICPYFEPCFEAKDISQIDISTYVVGGCCGSNVALMLLELVTPS